MARLGFLFDSDRGVLWHGWGSCSIATAASVVTPARSRADERILLPTFRIPTLIHTRSANSKWLSELSHRHPLWIHPQDAEALGIAVNGLVRVTTRIGHFVIGAWRTEGIRPGG